MSERRACRVNDADRKSVRYRSIRDDDGALREKLRELANQRIAVCISCCAERA
jgi:putative transposase